MKKMGLVNTMFTQEDLSVALKCFAQAMTNCLLLTAERTKRAMFYILVTCIKALVVAWFIFLIF